MQQYTYKPSSVFRIRNDNHSSGMSVTGHLKRSTRKHRAGDSQTLSYLILLQVRFTLPILSPKSRWALTPPFHHYLSPKTGHRLCIFCGTLCRITPPGRYPAPCPLELGLSSGIVYQNTSDYPVYFHTPIIRYILHENMHICQEKTEKMGEYDFRLDLVRAIFFSAPLLFPLSQKLYFFPHSYTTAFYFI